MQQAFDFGLADVANWKAALVGDGPDPLPVRRRSPLGQLVKSLLSARTRDAVSTAAYDALVAHYPDPAELAAGSPGAIAAVVAPVTFAAEKAANLSAALAMIGRERPDFDLAFLADLPLAEALAWLERLPGVARKVAASTLNASTLNRPVFIVDTHVLRVLARLGFVGPAADYRAASEAVTAAMPAWSGDDVLRFHIVMKRLGQTTCRWDAPACERCPLATQCPTARWERMGPPAWAKTLTARMG